MTPPGQTTADRGTSRAHARPSAVSTRRRRRRTAGARTGWDRRLRGVMIVVFGLVGWIGLRAALAIYTAHQQAAREGAVLQSLRTRHSELQGLARSLDQPATIMRDARQLGMVRSGERAYFVVSRAGN